MAVTVGATMSRVATSESIAAVGPSMATLSLTALSLSRNFTSPPVVQVFIDTVYEKPDPLTASNAQPAFVTNVKSAVLSP